MGILKHIIYMVLGLCICSCYTDFTPKTDTKPVLCLNCIITAGEPIKPVVSRTWLYTDIEDAQNDRVDDAVITIYANGKAVGSDYIPCHGDRIRIHAASQLYGEAEGEVVVPDPVPMGPVECVPRVTFCSVWETDSVVMGSLQFDMSLSVSVPDPADAENYYHYSLFGFSGYQDSPIDETDSFFGYIMVLGGMEVNYEPIFSEHISTMESITGAGAYGFTFFTDRQFNGQNYTLNLKYTRCEVSFTVKPDEIDTISDLGFVVRLNSVSPSYYTWFNYCWQVYDGLLGDLESVGLGDPIWGYSNVSTDAGVIVARSTSEHRIDMSAFVEAAIKDYLAENSVFSPGQ